MKQLLQIALILHFLFFFFLFSFAQPFTHADTLRGSNGPGRSWWDVQRYDLNVKFNIKDSTINGYNLITYKNISLGKEFQVDLQEPLQIDSIYATTRFENGQVIEKLADSCIRKDGNTYFIRFCNYYPNPKSLNSIKVYYHGKPRVAVKPPWDGGVVWASDSLGRPWISAACQEIGASVWYPCKDYQGDEPDDGASLIITVPGSLIAVGNGRFKDTVNNHDGTKTFRWEVQSPINNYCIIPYIGKYVHFGETYKGESGNLDMDYWVLDYDLQKAKDHFTDATRMMKAFEYWFGPYPFYSDGYKLVEAPYIGMENQSAIAYGNHFKNGYDGRDLSGTGWGLKWDFMIVHESGHEWFGNNITSKDIADMWIHEGFINYSEALFTEYYYGKKAGEDYVIGLRNNIVNDVPIIAPYGVNKEGSEDMYYKAANMLHTIRQVINNDSLFREILRGLNKTFYHQTVTSRQIETYINKKSKIDFSKVFDQYLRTTQIPVLEYTIHGNQLSFRWTNCVAGFNLPLKINLKTIHWISPTEQWQTILLNPKEKNKFEVDRNFYVEVKKVD